MLPLISVIVPVYNVEPYLRECLDSIVNQTYKNLEIILVDDGSTDNSAQICDEYADKDNRIKVIHKHNAGVVEARIDGLKESKAEYIIFVDSDDFIETNFISVMYKNLKEYNADLVCCQYFDYDAKSKKAPERPKSGYYNKNDIENVLKNNFLYDKITGIAGFNPFLCCKLIKRNKLSGCLEEGRTLFYGEDQVSTLSLLYTIDSMVVIKDYLYFYRKRGGQTTATYKDALWENMDLYFYKLNEVDRKDFLKEQIKLRNLTMVTMLTNMLFSEKSYISAKNVVEKYSNLEFVIKAKSNNYENFKIKRKVQLFLVKNNCWFFYYFMHKFYKILKQIVK